MSSITTNIQQSEQHGVKIWTYPTGEIGFSIFFPFGENETIESMAEKTKDLYTKLKEIFKVIAIEKDAQKEKEDLKIEISNDNKDNLTHVTISGTGNIDEIISNYKTALSEGKIKNE